MSIKKYANVKEKFDAVANHYNIKSYGDLALFLGVNYQTLMAWKKRDSIGDYSVFLDKCIGISLDWLKTGEGEMFEREERPNGVREAPAYGEIDRVSALVLEHLKQMSEEQRRDVLKYVEKEKLLEELMKDRIEKKAG